MSDAGFAEAMYDEIYGLNCTIGQLTVENAKLRELVRDVVLLAPNRGAGILRVEWSASDGSWLSIKDRMHELGVEI